jgi:meso-butanediol dehydrogenase / (S,S)-butanediol dehydrogenase / diacetyl reductase
MAHAEQPLAVITGAGSGIGRATAHCFSRAGYDVLLVGRTPGKLDTVSGEINAAGRPATVVAADLSQAAEIDRVFAQVAEKGDRLDVLVNCAAVGSSWADVSPGSMNEIGDTPVDKYHEILAINLDSTVLMCRRAIQLMQRDKRGAIINISSIYGIVGSPQHHSYGITKAGIIHLTRSMAVRYGRDGVRINCIVPGYIDTPMNEGVTGFFDEGAPGSWLVPIRRPGESDEIAEACLFLASPAASYITGVVLPVDGGWSAGCYVAIG